MGSTRGRLLVARVWNGAIVMVIVVSLVIQLAQLFSGGEDANSGADYSSTPVGTRLVVLFSFFTIDSNVVLAVVSALLVLDPLRRGPWWEVARLNALLAISITGIVYNVVLAPGLDLGGWALAASLGFHTVAPIAAVLVWLVLGPRPRFAWRTIAGAFILPVIWLVYTFVRGALTGRYPYPFLDAGEIGLGTAILNGSLVLAFALVLGVVFKLLDAVLPSALRDRSGA